MKSFIRLTSLFLLFISAACATHKDRPSHHHHRQACSDDRCDLKEGCKKKECAGENKCEMYEKKCAYLISHGDAHVKGKDEYKLVHKGHTYFFSSQESMEKFKENIDENVKRANLNWMKYDRR